MLLTKSIGITSGILIVVAIIVLGLRPSYQGTQAGFADENYLKSSDCRSCHADHHASWARTFHSRMTQEALPATVQGDFELNKQALCNRVIIRGSRNLAGATGCFDGDFRHRSNGACRTRAKVSGGLKQVL